MADDKQQQDPEAAEAERLAELRDLAIMDTPAEPEFDDLIETASRIAGKPIALMTLLDEDRQWFKVSPWRRVGSGFSGVGSHSRGLSSWVRRLAGASSAADINGD